MKERPILFSTDMVTAILDGRKTQTRRVIKNTDGTPVENDDMSYDYEGENVETVMDFSKTYPYWKENKCPYGNPEDLLYVRETFSVVPKTAYRNSDVFQIESVENDHDAFIYKASFDLSTGGIRWKPSIHMPKIASRIWLKVTGVRVERVQDISGKDAVMEGVKTTSEYARDYFANLWDSINAKRDGGIYAWEKNPWVWVVDFEVISTNGRPV